MSATIVPTSTPACIREIADHLETLRHRPSVTPVESEALIDCATLLHDLAREREDYGVQA